MGNQAESFEDDDGGADHDILEDARPDATHDSNGHLAGQTNPDANGITPQHDSEEMEGGNPHLQALLPNGDKYEDEGGEADQPHTKPPPPLNENKNENKNGNETTSVGVGVAKKKKKTKSKPKSKRGLGAPTGFEEFFVDAPVTPAEHEEERGLYHTSLSFAERIQTAIQRYFAKRNLNPERKDVFDKYMAYGGIDAGPKMFSGGLDAKTISNSNAAEIAARSATHFAPIGRGESDDPNFVVDFEGCAQGFFSSRMPSVFDLLSQQRIESYTAIIRNFLNFLLHHDVCPEYNDQIHAARRVCDQADRELWKIAQAGKLLPGNFNRACCEIFGGMYQGLYTGDQEWAEGVDSGCDLSPEAARKTFKFALTAQASNEMIEKYQSQTRDRSIGVTSVVDANLEVTELIPPSEAGLALYKSKAGDDLQPVGKLRAKSWFNPLAYPDDLTVEEEAAAAAGETGTTEHYEFWVEEELLRHCFVGMKLETKVHRTSFGVDYLDAVTGVWCSFFRLLPNEQVIGWRDPGPRLPMREKPGEEGGVRLEEGVGEDEGEGEEGGV